MVCPRDRNDRPLQAKEIAIVSKFIWANHTELINLETVSVVRLLAGDNVAHAFFPGSDKPVMMNGPAALAALETIAGSRPPKPSED